MRNNVLMHIGETSKDRLSRLFLRERGHLAGLTPHSLSRRLRAIRSTRRATPTLPWTTTRSRSNRRSNRRKRGQRESERGGEIGTGRLCHRCTHGRRLFGCRYRRRRRCRIVQANALARLVRRNENFGEGIRRTIAPSCGKGIVLRGCDVERVVREPRGSRERLRERDAEV